MTQEEKADENLKDKELSRRYRLLLCLTILIAIPVLITAVVVAIYYWPRVQPVEVVSVPLSPPNISDKQPMSNDVTTIDESIEADLIQDTLGRLLHQMEVEMFQNESEEGVDDGPEFSTKVDDNNSDERKTTSEIAVADDQPVHGTKQSNSLKPDLVTTNVKKNKNKTFNVEVGASEFKPCNCPDNRPIEMPKEDSSEIANEFQASPSTIFGHHDSKPDVMNEIERFVNSELQKTFDNLNFPGSDMFLHSDHHKITHQGKGHQNHLKSGIPEPSDIVSHFKKLDEFLGKDIREQIDNVQFSEMRSAFQQMNDMLEAIDHLQSMSLDDMFKMIPQHFLDNVSEFKDLPDPTDMPGWLEYLGLKGDPDRTSSFHLPDVPDIENIPEFMQGLGFGDIPGMKDIMKDVPRVEDIADFKNIPKLENIPPVEEVDSPRPPKFDFKWFK